MVEADPLVRVRLDLSYDGTDFSGWAVQPGRRTVQDELQKALATVLRLPSVALTVAPPRPAPEAPVTRPLIVVTPACRVRSTVADAPAVSDTIVDSVLRW